MWIKDLIAMVAAVVGVAGLVVTVWVANHPSPGFVVGLVLLFCFNLGFLLPWQLIVGVNFHVVWT